MDVEGWFDGNTLKTVVGRWQSVVGPWSLGLRDEAHDLQSDELQVGPMTND